MVLCTCMSLNLKKNKKIRLFIYYASRLKCFKMVWAKSYVIDFTGTCEAQFEVSYQTVHLWHLLAWLDCVADAVLEAPAWGLCSADRSVTYQLSLFLSLNRSLLSVKERKRIIAVYTFKLVFESFYVVNMRYTMFLCFCFCFFPFVFDYYY